MSEKQDFFTIMGGRVKMRRGLYNPTSDAVWLASFVDNSTKKTALDVGIGTGGVALCLMARMPKLQITGLDISTEMLNECAENARLNNRELELINADILSWRTTKSFDLVISNPPYFKGTPAKHDAHHNTNLTLWTRKCIARVRPKGTFATIVDASASGEVIAEIARHCGDIIIFPLFSKKNTAERVLISGRLGVRSGTRIFSGLDMNNEAILRDGLTITDYLAMLAKL